MYKKNDTRKVFEKKLYLSLPTMHDDELKYIVKTYNTNWRSIVGDREDLATCP